jgi:hypothetical protein
MPANVCEKGKNSLQMKESEEAVRRESWRSTALVANIRQVEK